MLEYFLKILGGFKKENQNINSFASKEKSDQNFAKE
jgi:hypothetical protein